MPNKSILVLANSTKHYPMSCIAGREVAGLKDEKLVFGKWIRPVSNHDEGALSVAERRLADGSDPKPYDVILVPLAGREDNPLQPENWFIANGNTWSKTSIATPGVLIDLIEAPDDLWLQPGSKSDRVESSFIKRLPNPQSLYLISPETFYLEVRSKTWEGQTTKQQRGVFTYKGKYYDLKLTDEVILKKYFPNFPRVQDGTVYPSTSQRIVLCISLTPPFNGPHYKVIATVLELPK